MSKLVRTLRAVANLAVATVPAIAAMGPTTKAAGLIDAIGGTWSGRGKIVLDSGNAEDLSCRATYTTSKTTLSLALRCASASYKTEIRSHLRVSGETLTGPWEERTYNASGEAAGAITGNRITLRITGPLDGRLSIEQLGARQSVVLTSTGGGLSAVRIALVKS